MQYIDVPQEFDVGIEYVEGSIALFSGIKKALLKDPTDNFKLHWVTIPTLNILDAALSKKPSLVAMLREYYDAYQVAPCEVAQKFMIEQYKVEFDYWSKNK